MNEKCAIVIKDKSEEVGRKNAMKDEKSKITAVAIEKMIDFIQTSKRGVLLKSHKSGHESLE